MKSLLIQVGSFGLHRLSLAPGDFWPTYLRQPDSLKARDLLEACLASKLKILKSLWVFCGDLLVPLTSDGKKSEHRSF